MNFANQYELIYIKLIYFYLNIKLKYHFNMLLTLNLLLLFFCPEGTLAKYNFYFYFFLNIAANPRRQWASAKLNDLFR